MGTLTILGTSDNILWVSAVNGGSLSTTAPHMQNTFNQPNDNANYTIQAVFKAGSNPVQHGTGDFVIYQLIDASGNEVLQLGFKIADNTHLQITDDAASGDMRTTTYTAPQTFRNYTVTIDPVGGTYDLNVWNGNSVDFSATGVSYLASSNGRAARLVIGSLSSGDTAVGYWNDIKVEQ